MVAKKKKEKEKNIKDNNKKGAKLLPTLQVS